MRASLAASWEFMSAIISSFFFFCSANNSFTASVFGHIVMSPD